MEMDLKKLDPEELPEGERSVPAEVSASMSTAYGAGFTAEWTTLARVANHFQYLNEWDNVAVVRIGGGGQSARRPPPPNVRSLQQQPFSPLVADSGPQPSQFPVSRIWGPFALSLPKPLLQQPFTFFFKCEATVLMGPELRASHRGQICEPLPFAVWFDVGSADDRQTPQTGEWDLLSVKAPHVPRGGYDELHGACFSHLGLRRMFRRGRSTSSPSRTD